jgi:hypothetical protein
MREGRVGISGWMTEIWIFSEMICASRAFLYRGEFAYVTHTQIPRFLQGDRG